MLKTIFTKTLYERRWLVFWWSLVTLLLIIAIVALFPLFKDSISSLDNVPESLQSLVGNTADYNTLAGWLSFQVFDQMVLIGIILGIILGGSILAGDEKEGTLQSLLALPVRRSKVYLQKFAAVTVIMAAVTLSLLLGVLAGLLVIGESAGISPILTSSFMAFLLGLFFAALTYAIGAVTGQRGLAGTLVGLFAFASYMISALAPGISALKYVDYLSPFHYFNKPSSFEVGFQAQDAFVLTLAIVLALVVGFTVFIQRDIYRR